MKPVTCLLLVVLTCATDAFAQRVTRDIAYASAHERQVLDVYAPDGAKNLPVVFWIHGGGWQAGNKTMVGVKPKAFMEAGLVFVSISYRLLPSVDMAALTSDVATALGWVHKNIATYGGDPTRLLVMGHSAGGQLAALMCTDEKYVNAGGFSLTTIKGCMPVDADTFDIPAIIEASRLLRRDPRGGEQGHSAVSHPSYRGQPRHQRAGSAPGCRPPRSGDFGEGGRPRYHARRSQ
jgi:arylformamidase